MAILKNKLVVIIVVVLLLGGGGAYYFLFMGDKSAAAGHGGKGEAHASDEHGDGHDEHGDSEEHGEDGEDEGDDEEDEEEESGGHGGGHGESKGPVMEPFVVNLADPGSRRYLRLNMKVKLRKPEESEPLLEQRMPQVRDAVLMHLSSKTTDQLLSTEGKVTLREELIVEMNKALKKKKLKKAVKNLYFTEFLIQ